MPHAHASPAGATFRQWAVFPILPGRVRLSSPQVFRLLVETGAGRLLIAAITLREPPDAALAADLAALADDRRFADQPLARIQGGFEARHGQMLELLDIDLDSDDPVSRTGIVARTLVEAIRLVRPGAAGSPLRREDVEARCRSEWAALRDRFIGGLDAGGVSEARRAGGLTPSAYNYATMTGAEEQRNRLQAVQVFPLLRPLLTTRPYRTVLEAIDQGRPLVDTLAAHWRVPKARVKALRGIGGEDLGPLVARLPLVLDLLGDIPPDWWPRTPEVWRLFAAAVQAIRKISRRPATSTSNRLWLRDSARRGYAIGEHAPEEVARMGEDIEEFMHMLRQALEHVHAGWLRDAPDEARDAHLHLLSSLFSGMGPEKLARTARRFGDHYRRTMESFAAEAELWVGLRWPSIGPPSPRTFAGVVVHPLLTPEELRAEGRRMRNCVAGYAKDCLRGRCQIWSLRHEDGSPLSTLETRSQKGDGGLYDITVAQHKGHANMPPPAAAKRALRAFMTDLRKNQNAIAEYHAWQQKVLRHPLSERQRHAFMHPVLTALEETLTGKWAWQTLARPDPGRLRGA